MKKMQKGFTLIELMIVVAIIAILAAIAIPAYQDYLIRTQVSEGAVLTDGAKTAVAEYYSNHGTFPPTQTSAGLAAAASISGSYVSAVTLTPLTGVITATYSNVAPQKANTAINGAMLVLSPSTTAGSIKWTCKTGAPVILPKYLPASCR